MSDTSKQINVEFNAIAGVLSPVLPNEYDWQDIRTASKAFVDKLTELHTYRVATLGLAARAHELLSAIVGCQTFVNGGKTYNGWDLNALTRAVDEANLYIRGIYDQDADLTPGEHLLLNFINLKAEGALSMVHLNKLADTARIQLGRPTVRKIDASLDKTLTRLETNTARLHGH